MLKLIHGQPNPRAEGERIIAAIGELIGGEKPFFNRRESIFVARAPGRLDVMGGMADYSGATVFEATIAEGTYCAVQKRPDSEVHIRSIGIGENSFELNAVIGLADILGQSLVELRQSLAHGDNRWLAFPLGVIAVLSIQRDSPFPQGMNICLWSAVPLGRGVSSSAALEISLIKALVEAFHLPASHREIPYWAHLVENNVVGQPCGMMDQYASSHGLYDHLLPIVCQPDTVLDPVPVKEDITFVGIDTGLRAKLTKANYNDIRVAAFMGYRIIADLLGFKVRSLQAERNLVEIEDPIHNGYLANIATSHFDDRFRDNLPEQISGRDFIGKYQGITDSISTLKAKSVYAVRTACQNQVYENLRTVLFLQLLRAYAESEDEHILNSLGELMYLSHRSYIECGLGDEAITALVRQIREAGPRVGLYGAKITGSGTGGTIAVLLKKRALPALHEILTNYGENYATKPRLFFGDSPGAIEYGHLVLKWFD
jgi:galactokinase